MNRTILMLLTLMPTAHSLNSCASSPSAASSSSFNKQSAAQTDSSSGSVLECPWGPMAMHGWRSDGISRMFAAAEKATMFEGQVSKVLNDKSDVYMPHVILLVTKTKRPKEEVIVHAGPAWFLKQQGLLINPNDIVIVTGRLLNSDENTVIATSVSKDKKTVNLRDKTGRPAWARGPHMSP